MNFRTNFVFGLCFSLSTGIDFKLFEKFKLFWLVEGFAHCPFVTKGLQLTLWNYDLCSILSVNLDPFVASLICHY